MVYKYDVMIALGGTNIEERMFPVSAGYIKGRTPVAMFAGRWQGKDAVRYFSSWGIPPYSENTKRGYIVLKDDSSATTKQNAYYSRVVVDSLSLGNRICISTEFHHGKRALRDYRWFFPEPEYQLNLVTVGATIKNPKEILLRYIHEPISLFFDAFFVDYSMSKAKTLDDAFKIYSRDKSLQPVLDKLRGYESRAYMTVGSESEEEVVGVLVEEKGKLITK